MILLKSDLVKGQPSLTDGTCGSTWCCHRGFVFRGGITKAFILAFIRQLDPTAQPGRAIQHGVRYRFRPLSRFEHDW